MSRRPLKHSPCESPGRLAPIAGDSAESVRRAEASTRASRRSSFAPAGRVGRSRRARFGVYSRIVHMLGPGSTPAPARSTRPPLVKALPLPDRVFESVPEAGPAAVAQRMEDSLGEYENWLRGRDPGRRALVEYVREMDDRSASVVGLRWLVTALRHRHVRASVGKPTFESVVGRVVERLVDRSSLRPEALVGLMEQAEILASDPDFYRPSRRGRDYWRERQERDAALFGLYVGLGLPVSVLAALRARHLERVSDGWRVVVGSSVHRPGVRGFTIHAASCVTPLLDRACASPGSDGLLFGIGKVRIYGCLASTAYMLGLGEKFLSSCCCLDDVGPPA